MFRKILIGLLLAASALWGLLLAALHLLYSSNLPSVPDKDTAHIYRMVVNHGFVRFATDREVRTLQLMENGLPIAMVLFMSAIVLGLRLGVLHIRGEAPKAKNIPNRSKR